MNNKFKRFNKILMMTVAILLCFVLISTSVVSGIFAKYVITKSAGATVSLKAFGVTLTMSTPGETELEDSTIGGATVNTEVKDGESGTISITGLKMAPGYDFTDAIRFTFGGKPTVPVQVKITPTITFNTSATKTQADSIFSVPSGKITGITTTKYYMPVGFTFSYNSTTQSDDITVSPAWSTNTTNSTLQNAIAAGIKDEITGSSAVPPSGSDEISVSNNVVTIGTFAKGTAITFNINGNSTASTYFQMGLFYPLDSKTDVDLYNKISTYMGKNTSSAYSMTVSYKVEIVQVS